MFNIADYFKKFTKIEGDSLQESDAIKAAIYEASSLDKVNFKIQKGILYIQGSPMLKSTLFTKKAAILGLIKAKSPKSRISDIR